MWELVGGRSRDSRARQQKATRYYAPFCKGLFKIERGDVLFAVFICGSDAIETRCSLRMFVPRTANEAVQYSWWDPAGGMYGVEIVARSEGRCWD